MATILGAALLCAIVAQGPGDRPETEVASLLPAVADFYDENRARFGFGSVEFEYWDGEARSFEAAIRGNLDEAHVAGLCLALHLAFDFAEDRDRFIRDTSHQIYPHKLITGRWEQIHTIRTRGGLMGYPNPAESDYDRFMTDHACSFDHYRDSVYDRTFHPGSFPATSSHPGGVNVLMMDGHVRFVRDSIALPTWRGLATRSGGEVISPD